jgi:hypothetical protein
VRTNWSVVAAILAVLAVPFSIAAIQDFGRQASPFAADPGGGAVDAIPGELGDLAAEPDNETRQSAPRRPDDSGDDMGWRRAQVMDRSFFDRVFLAGESGPGLHGALAGARFGMTRDQLRAEAGALWRWAEQGISEFHHADVRLEFHDRGEGLSVIAIRFPDDGGARAVLASVWGSPVTAIGQDDRVRYIWFDSRSRTRVVVHHERSPATVNGTAEVIYQRIQPVASFYRRGRGFAFEERAILGATAAELAATFGSNFEFDPSSSSAARLRVDPTDYAPGPTQCTVAFQDGVAIALQIVVDHALKTDFDVPALSALREQLGPVRETARDEDGERWTFDDRITVQKFVGSRQLVISVSR